MTETGGPVSPPELSEEQGASARKRGAMGKRNDVVLSDFGSLCRPAAALSAARTATQWELVPYETTGGYQGTLIASLKGGTPPPVTLSPQLTGWYAIFVCIGAYANWGAVNTHVNLQLTRDGAPSNFVPGTGGQDILEESYWKCADMTGQDVTISKFSGLPQEDAVLAWLRFVPLTEEEAMRYQQDTARTDTKVLYATHDMHGMLGQYCPETPEEWCCILENYRDSDVRSVSLENVFIFNGEITPGQDTATYPFFRDFDRMVQQRLPKYYTDELMAKLFAYGHSMGLEMYFSLRMGFWGIEFPFDRFYFDVKFFRENPQWRCRNRDGEMIHRMSYVYPEVQDYMLDQFSHMAEQDCDGVEMLLNRGAPFVLFEPPFVEAFRQKYGVDPCLLPLEDERVQAMHCEIMTGFVRRLRERLDRERAARGQKRLKLIARGLLNLSDNLVQGIDLEQWAREGLIDAVISYPVQLRENLTGDVWQTEHPDLLDLEKYHKLAMTVVPPLTESFGDFRFAGTEPSAFTKQFYVPVEERVRQFAALEDRYGVEVYHDIMPRQLSPQEYRARALELYRAGAKRFSLWDTYGRVPVRSRWYYAARLGHAQELETIPTGEGVMTSLHYISRIGGVNCNLYAPRG